MVRTFLQAEQAEVRNNICGLKKVFMLPGKPAGFTFSHLVGGSSKKHYH